MKLDHYQTLVFDCDGVILNSNKVKTQGFYNAALPYGEDAAQALVDYHVANGGVSRYKKFEMFLDNMVPPGMEGPSLDNLLSTYANEVREGLLTCEVVDGLSTLREKTAHANWLIVSGGDQIELREIFAQRGLSTLFDGGIFGSPDTKHEIFSREIECGTVKQPALFFGDSKYDLTAALTAQLDFVFLHAWSEIKDWQTWAVDNNLFHLSSLNSIGEHTS